jgi:hypothetical protein
VMTEHDHEPVHGLPATPPAGERILWQGSPTSRALALRAFHVRGVALYFAILMAWRAAENLAGGQGIGDTAIAVIGVLPLALAGLAVLVLLAWLNARATVYTITDRRVVMRFGVALPMTVNLPFKVIDAAGLALHGDGTGDVTLTLHGPDRIAWLHLWPHVRPWRLARPQPMLRGLPQPQRAADILAAALVSALADAPAAAAASAHAPAPVRGKRAARLPNAAMTG